MNYCYDKQYEHEVAFVTIDCGAINKDCDLDDKEEQEIYYLNRYRNIESFELSSEESGSTLIIDQLAGLPHYSLLTITIYSRFDDYRDEIFLK